MSNLSDKGEQQRLLVAGLIVVVFVVADDGDDYDEVACN